MRRAAKADTIQKRIVKVLRACGATVVHTHMVGGGFPDLVVGFLGTVFIAEVKSSAAISHRSRTAELTPDQIDFHLAWPTKIYTLRSEGDAMRMIGVSEMPCNREVAR